MSRETQCKDAEAVIAQMKHHEGTEILNLSLPARARPARAAGWIP